MNSTTLVCHKADRINKKLKIISQVIVALLLIWVLTVRPEKTFGLMVTSSVLTLLLALSYIGWTIEKAHGRSSAYHQGHEVGTKEGKEAGQHDGKSAFYGRSRRSNYGLARDTRYEVRIVSRKKNTVHMLLVVNDREVWYAFNASEFDDTLGEIQYHKINSLSLRHIHREEYIVEVFQDQES